MSVTYKGVTIIRYPYRRQWRGFAILPSGKHYFLNYRWASSWRKCKNYVDFKLDIRFKRRYPSRDGYASGGKYKSSYRYSL